MMMGYEHGWGFGFGGIFMILFWIAVVVLLVAAVRWLMGVSTGGGPGQSPGAREILDRRYARGELTREEYEATRRDSEQ